MTLALGAACLASLGLALGTVAKTAEQAQPLAQLTFLPVSFISGIWFPLSGAPDWLVTLAHLFPLYHIVNAFDACFVPQTQGAGWSPDDLLSIALWLAWPDRGHAAAAAGGDGRLEAAEEVQAEQSSACWASMLSCVSSPVNSSRPITISTTPGDRGDDQVAVAQPAEGGRQRGEGDRGEQERHGQAERVEEQQDAALGRRCPATDGGGEDRAERRARRTASRRTRTPRRRPAGRRSRRARSAPRGATRG